MLADLLAEQAHWMELDDHYRARADLPAGAGAGARAAAPGRQPRSTAVTPRGGPGLLRGGRPYQPADGEAWAGSSGSIASSADWPRSRPCSSGRSSSSATRSRPRPCSRPPRCSTTSSTTTSARRCSTSRCSSASPSTPRRSRATRSTSAASTPGRALRDLILYQIEQATAAQPRGQPEPLDDAAFAAGVRRARRDLRAPTRRRRRGRRRLGIECQSPIPHDPQPREQIVADPEAHADVGQHGAGPGGRARAHRRSAQATRDHQAARADLPRSPGQPAAGDRAVQRDAAARARATSRRPGR